MRHLQEVYGIQAVVLYDDELNLLPERIQNIGLDNEIVVIDDASTDGTREFLQVLAAEAGGEVALLAAVRVGVSEFLVPPIDPRDLAGRIRRLIRQACGACALGLPAPKRPEAIPPAIPGSDVDGRQAMLQVEHWASPGPLRTTCARRGWQG